VARRLSRSRSLRSAMPMSIRKRRFSYKRGPAT
jgi:hypothetical protein